MMLEELCKKGYLNYQKIILDYGKILGLTAEEGFVFTKILENYLRTENLLVQDLEKDILMSSSRMDKVVASLMERGYYEIFLAYDNGVGKECISFRPFFEKVEAILTQTVDLSAYDIEKVNQYVSSKMNRILTASELEILQGWLLEDHYTYEDIVKCIEKLISERKNLSMRSITLGLSQKDQKIEPNVEAPKVFKEFLKKI